MKTILFEVALKFDASIETDEEIKEIANNLMHGIVYQINNYGLAPEGDCCTESVVITEPYSELRIDRVI